MKAEFKYQEITAYFHYQDWRENPVWIYWFDVDGCNCYGTHDLIQTIALARTWIDEFIAEYGPMEDVVAKMLQQNANDEDEIAM